ncbi:hypothetical protein JCM30237_04210 [Halolamina litorea]|uniref:DUF1028 domain-containing protein n=1 Tax=Halolamina litorea TaxID=1515593 RepID=A0ABD6BQ51_9EURY|nr:DUF1028 domain-containing protein [Halolamina litorea]
MTFSITAADPETGKTGVAIASVFPSVGAVCPWVSEDVGLSTQAWDSGADYGEPLLEMLARNIRLESAAEAVLANRPGSAGTQLHGTEVDGETYAYTGEKATEWAGHVVGENHTAAGNTLAGEAVVTKMHEAFEDADGPLTERLLTALTAGEAAGGDKRGDNLSAAVLVHAPESKLYHNMRVDQPGNPIDGLWDAYEAGRDHAEAVENTDDLAAEWGEGFEESIAEFQMRY